MARQFRQRAPSPQQAQGLLVYSPHASRGLRLSGAQSLDWGRFRPGQARQLLPDIVELGALPQALEEDGIGGRVMAGKRNEGSCQISRPVRLNRILLGS